MIKIEHDHCQHRIPDLFGRHSSQYRTGEVIKFPSQNFVIGDVSLVGLRVVEHSLELLEIEDQKVKQGGGAGRRSPAGRNPRGKAVKAKRKKDKIKRKVTRTRR